MISFCLITLSLMEPASAEEVRLQWDPVDDPRVAGYEVYYGHDSGVYEQKVDTASTTVTVAGLQPGATYYFSVRACPTDRVVCSPFTDEVSATIPESAPVASEPPTAGFTVNRSSGYAPLIVVLSDASSGDITQRKWELGDGGTSSATDVVYTYTAPGTYTVKLAVTGSGGTDEEVKSAFIEVISSAPVAALGLWEGVTTTVIDTDTAQGGGQNDAIEVGELDITHEWRRVNFQYPFSDPIVIAKSLSYKGGDPAVVRVDDVDAEGFWIGIHEWDYRDGAHTTETAGYLVMERGRHQLADGTWIEADRVETSATNASEQTAFKGPFNAPPVVLAAVTTVNGIDAVTARVRNIDSSGFDVGLREQEAFVQSHAIETIDYIAWEPSSGVLDGLRFEVGRTADEVTGQAHSLVFENAFDRPPIFIAGMQTIDGGDTANLRWHAKTASGVDVWVDEEQSYDSETAHTTEVVGYFVFE